MDAITILKTDHDKVKALFEETENAESSKKLSLFEKIRKELEIHTHIEETVLYPKLKEISELKEITLEAVEEHHQAKVLLREIASLVEVNDKFTAKLKVLKEDIEHHVEEEENEMFPQMKEFFDAEELEKIGAELEREKQSFKKSVAAVY